MTDETLLLGVGAGDLANGTVELAVTMASRLDLGIEVVHVVPTIDTGPLGTWELGATADELAHQGRDAVDGAVARVRERMGGARPVTGRLLDGRVVDVLVEQSARAPLLVLERRDVGRWSRWASASVTAGVVARSRAPVVSVPASWRPSGRPLPVTVAVGEGPRAAGELWTGLGLAAGSEQQVVALRATYLAPAIEELVGHALSRDRILRSARLELERDAELPEDVRRRLSCSYKVRWGRPGDVLVEASHHSSILVMARRGPTTPAGAHLGPVVRQVLREATCPVLVVEPSPAGPLASRPPHPAAAASAGTT